MIRRAVVAAFVAAVTAVAALAAAPAPAPADGDAAARERAQAFVAAFFAGRDDEARRAMTDEMRAALTPGAAQELRLALAAQVGALQRTGDARIEAVVPGYRVVRLPATFGNATLDFRVSVDPAGRVGGFFVVPHEEASPAPATPAPPAASATPAAPAPPKAPAPAAASAPAPRELEVTVGGAQDGLPGTLALPDGAGRFPAVVLVHGSGPNDRDETLGPNKPFRDLAHGLARAGVAVLRYDKRSFARPDELLAHGAALTARQEVLDDAVAAVALLRARPEVDPARVYVLGHSLGATLAPRIAAAVAPRPAGVVLLAAAARPLHVLVPLQVRHIVEADGNVTDEERAYLESITAAMEQLGRALAGAAEPPAGNVMGAPFGYWKDLARHDPAAEAARLGLPALVLQGGRDYQVSAEDDFGAFARALRNREGACVRLYPALDHLFRAGEGASTPDDYARPAPLDPVVVRDIARFVIEHRCPEAS